MTPATEDEALGRRERRKLEVERRIRRAGEELFSDQSYESTTVEEIAARADVAKATFFNYFPRKELLLRAIVEDQLAAVQEAFGAAERWPGTASAQLQHLFLELASIAEKNPSLHRALARESMRTYWDRTERDAVEQSFRAVNRRLLQRAVDAGEVSPDTDVEVAASLLEAAYMTTMVEWLWEGAPQGAVRRTLQEKFDVIFRGLGGLDRAVEGVTP
jgi:TetR/AcrR family transcriptional regulator, cholesterol catabolism regulator